MALFSTIMAIMHTLRLSKEYRVNAEENAQLLKEQVKVAKQQNTQLVQAKHDADVARQEALAATLVKILVST